MGPAPESPPGYACQAPEAPGTPWGGGRSRLLGKERVQAGLVSEAVGNFRPSESESDRPRFAAIRRPIETLQSNWVRPGDPSTTFFHTFPGTFRARKGVPIPINPYQSLVRRRNLPVRLGLGRPSVWRLFFTSRAALQTFSSCWQGVEAPPEAPPDLPRRAGV